MIETQEVTGRAKGCNVVEGDEADEGACSAG